MIDVPLRLINPLNVHEQWHQRAKRQREQRASTFYALKAAKAPYSLPCVVTVTRVAPRPLDSHDGLPAACKAVVDGIADYLLIKDDDPRVTWRYAQHRGEPKYYAAHITIEATA